MSHLHLLRPDSQPSQENVSSGEASVETNRPNLYSNSPSQVIGPQSLFSESSTSCRPGDHSSSLATTFEDTELTPALEAESSQLQRDDPPTSNPILPPKALIIHLVKVYFDFVHPQIRLLHQPSFVEWIQNGSLAFDKHATLILTSIFSLAARYSDHPEVDLFDQSLLLRTSNSCDTQDIAFYKSRKRWDRGKGFLSQAHRLLALQTSELDKAELESGGMQRPPILVVQASILISFAQLVMGLNSQTYSALSTAVRLAYDCGLDQVDCDDEVVPTTRFINLDSSHLWIKKEELRRAWWAVAYLENFICVTKDRPRMINWGKCKMKLPCDDKDWFKGRQQLSNFLPANVYDLRASLPIPHHLSILAYRIITMHSGAQMVETAVNSDGLSESDNLFSIIEECAMSCKQNIPMDPRIGSSPQGDSRQIYDLADHLHLRIVLEWQVPRSRLSLFTIDLKAQHISDNEQNSLFCRSNAVRYLHILPGCLSAATTE